MPGKKKYQVFVSSTYLDLKAERQAAVESILEYGHIPAGMELFAADDEEQWATIKEWIDESDIYILILGGRYGSVEEKSSLSYTELEYDYAVAQGKPYFALVIDNDFLESKVKIDGSEMLERKNPQKLEAFKKKVLKRMSTFFKDLKDIKYETIRSISRLEKKRELVGWVKADEVISPEISEELAALSTENRELREQVQSLQERIGNRAVDIAVSFNGETSLLLPYKTPDEFDKVKIDYPNPITKVPEYLTEEYISSDEIEEYNEDLPDEEKIDEYNKSLYGYLKVTECNVPIAISVANGGSFKANDVVVEVKFPDEIVVFEKSDIKELELPKSPVPENPIEKAEEKYKKEMARRKNPLRALSSMMVEGDLSLFRSPLADLGPNLAAHLRRSEEARVKDNVVIIEINSLLHTRKLKFDEFAIVGRESGRFEVEVSIICEELSEPVSQTVELTLDEQGVAVESEGE